jgi:HD superfamily phosphodiesterase
VRDVVGTAAGVAAEKLSVVLPRRWVHVQAVAAKADSIARAVSDPEVLIVSAWLHDIGYAPDIADTGLHSLDGARWLVRNGWDRRIAG